ncbi:hypothetical protein BXZ70DRAFT_909035 [Cristinia sonorae]|uniref:DUF7082 domain-containing protein n=1 Tax=Cristinia sonorae TaxID=1940300 RepID=A0A8K0XMP3_9AGAR|nr:hypothetical protein BXZ70DRAFT_909035 [Cristinia sonorae]
MNSTNWGYGYSGDLRVGNSAADLTAPSIAGPSEPTNYGQFRYDANCLASSHTAQGPPTRFLSSRGFFKVTDFLVLAGNAGWPIHASITFNHRTNEVIFLRLVLGQKALTTSVTQQASGTHGEWHLDAVAPHASDVQHSSLIEIPLTVQALRGSGDVLDSLLIGVFSYNVGHDASVPSSEQHPVRQRSLDGGRSTRPPDLPEIVAGSSSSRPPSASSSTIARSRTHKSVRGVGQKNSQVLMRTRRQEPGEDLGESYRVTFDLLTPLDTMCTDFTDEEITAGRRLVRFTSQIDGTHLRVSCERVRQEEYSEGDAVVSCIYRRDNGKCYFTSVDVICLLEGLVGEAFEIEEKNRIRRNLEGFHPETVSKSRKDSEEFFQQIMEFPSPKPRHIEKDVKVFHWSLLGRALDKIISKYSLYSMPAKLGRHTPRSSPSSDAGVPPAVVPSQPHPDALRETTTVGHDNPFIYTQSQYHAPSGMPYHYGARQPFVNVNQHPGPNPMSWSGSMPYSTPTISPTPSPSSPTLPERQVVHGFGSRWTDDMRRPLTAPNPSLYPYHHTGFS